MRASRSASFAANFSRSFSSSVMVRVTFVFSSFVAAADFFLCASTNSPSSAAIFSAWGWYSASIRPISSFSSASICWRMRLACSSTNPGALVASP